MAFHLRAGPSKYDIGGEAKFYWLRNWTTESGATRITNTWGGGSQLCYHLPSVRLSYNAAKVELKQRGRCFSCCPPAKMMQLEFSQVDCPLKQIPYFSEVGKKIQSLYNGSFIITIIQSETTGHRRKRELWPTDDANKTWRRLNIFLLTERLTVSYPTWLSADTLHSLNFSLGCDL